MTTLFYVNEPGHNVNEPRQGMVYAAALLMRRKDDQNPALTIMEACLLNADPPAGCVAAH